ncbi:MAG: cupin domain-containing protein [Nitrososphaerota archaeon]
MSLVRRESEVGREQAAGARRTYIQWLIDRRDGAPNFELRKFTLEPGGEIPAHLHPDIEHEQYVLRGEYTITLDGKSYRVGPGMAIYIPPNTVHSYRNDGPEPAEFLCIIPRRERYGVVWVEEERGNR